MKKTTPGLLILSRSQWISWRGSHAPVCWRGSLPRYGLLILAFLVAACDSLGGLSPESVQATVDAAVAATAASLPQASVEQVTVEVPTTVEVPVTVEVPGPTVEVPVTVIVTAIPPPPAPTATLRAETPTATPVVTPTLTSGAGPDPLADTTGVLFDEDFAPSDFWGTGEDAIQKFAVEDGQLVGTLKEGGRLAWTLNAFRASDFFMQATVISGSCRAGDYYGLVFRAKDESNLYFFGISCDGQFKVLKSVNGELIVLSDFRPHPAIRPLGDATNVIGVRADGNEFSFYANDVFLGTVTDDTFREGRFGVGLRSFQTAPLTVAFDDVKAWIIQH